MEHCQSRQRSGKWRAGTNTDKAQLREREKKTVRERVRESGESDTCLTVAAAAWQASSGCRCSLSAHAYTMPGEARSSRGSCNQAARQRGNQAGTLAAPRATTFRFTCSGVIKLQFLYNIYTQWVVVAVRGYPHRGGGRQGASVECGKSSCPWHIMTFRHSCKCRQQASPWRLPYNTDITICGLLGIMHVCWSPPPRFPLSPLVCVGVYVWVCMLLC